MKRCPQCDRFGIEYDSYTGAERCLWKDCSWVNKDNTDVNKHKHKLNYKKFKDSIKKKKNLVFD